MRDPARTIPSAIPLALGITLVIDAAVALAALLAVGPERLAGAEAPLAEAVRAGSLDWLAGAVRVGAVVTAVVLAADIRGAIAFSSFSVLVYYAIANASAWTLRPQERRWPRWLAGLGLAGCLLWQPPCPSPVVAVGAAMLAIGATGRMVLTAPGETLLRGCSVGKAASAAAAASLRARTHTQQSYGEGARRFGVARSIPPERRARRTARRCRAGPVRAAPG